MTLAMDFGTCNTVLARWQRKLRQVDTLRIGAPTRLYNYLIPGACGRQVSAVVPSLIHYGDDQNIVLGAQVDNTGLASHKNTFRWMKLDLLKGKNRARRINQSLVTPRQAAEDLIKHLLLTATAQDDDDLVVTLPVEAFDPYVDWLQSTVLRFFNGQVRMLDEATACILGYGTKVKEGRVYVIFDFGGGTLDVSIVKTMDLDVESATSCMVLGRAGEEIGGTWVDSWLLQELQQACGYTDYDFGEIGTDLLHAVEYAKVRLCSGADYSEVVQFDDIHQRHIKHTFTTTDLRRILATSREALGHRNIYQLITLTVERALEQAQERYGVRRAEIRSVFMVGGSSLLLGVTELIERLLPGCPIHCEKPFEAIACGACRYVGGNINLALVHDYCARAWDPEHGEYVLVPIVPKGTRYPTNIPVAVKYINGACEGATTLGLVITERSDMIRPANVWEMIGGRLQRRHTDWHEDNTTREINPEDQEFIHADPPCSTGTRRFVASFGIDVHRRLTLTLKDLDPNGHSYVQTATGERLALPIVDMPFTKL